MRSMVEGAAQAQSAVMAARAPSTRKPSVGIPSPVTGEGGAQCRMMVEPLAPAYVAPTMAATASSTVPTSRAAGSTGRSTMTTATPRSRATPSLATV